MKNTDNKTISELIIISESNGQQAISALAMYKALGLVPSHWQRWYKKNIISNKLFLQGIDYQSFRHKGENPLGGRPKQDFIISLDMAMKLCLHSHSKKAKEVLAYFENHQSPNDISPNHNISQNQQIKSNAITILNESDIQNMVYEIRGQRVMLDSDLAQLYGVETKNLNKAVRRNLERFPEDFMFELTNGEYNSLKITSRFQIGTLKEGRGHNIKYAPYAFTEQGVAMLSSVLSSKTAIETNIKIMRAFVAARRLAEQYSTLKKEKEVEIPTNKEYLLNAFATLEPDLENYNNTVLTLNFLTTRECFLKTILPLVKLYGGKYRGNAPGYLFTALDKAVEAQKEINTQCFSYMIPIIQLNNTSRYALRELGLYDEFKKTFKLKEQLYA